MKKALPNGHDGGKIRTINKTIQNKNALKRTSRFQKAYRELSAGARPVSYTHLPHPLHDKLIYIARDGDVYREERDKDGRSPYSLYVELLGKWVQSPYCNPKVEAVYKYVTQHDICLLYTSIVTGTDTERGKTSAVQSLLHMTSMNRDNFCHDGFV